MLRTALWTLRQPRYAALAALMFVIAVLCVVAGTWQVSRFEQSVHDNDALTGNAHAAATPLTTGLVPLVGTGAAPGRDAIRYRTVTASGSYGATSQLVTGQSVNSESGYYVLTPLRTDAGTLLVVRGFVAATSQGTPPASVPSAPGGTVTVTGRLQTPESKKDDAAGLSGGQIASINPSEQRARLGSPVYDAYLTLDANQPGSSGLTALPAPDLSNPAGGAVEPQHFAYIIQWYLFAILALAAPFAIGRNEVRDARRRFLGVDEGEQELGLEAAPAPAERRALESGTADRTAVAVRAPGELARPTGPSAQQYRRAARLADRYGRSLGRDQSALGDELDVDERPRRPRGTPAAAPVLQSDRLREADVVADSAAEVHRSPDAYHGSYNDYLWQLALADGDIPDGAVTDKPVPRSDDDR